MHFEWKLIVSIFSFFNSRYETHSPPSTTAGNGSNSVNAERMNTRSTRSRDDDKDGKADNDVSVRHFSYSNVWSSSV